jgi:hypothetical protein
MTRTKADPLVRRADEILAGAFAVATGSGDVATGPLLKYEQPVTARAANRIRERVI